MMATLTNKSLKADKEAQYIGIALGCKQIASNFERLSLLYSDAIDEKRELQGEFQFKNLPSVYSMVLRLGIQLYDILTSNGISIEMSEEPLEIKVY